MSACRLLDIEDVRKAGENPGSAAGDPHADNSLFGDLLPEVGGVELATQPGVRIGELTAVARVDTVRPVASATVLARDGAGGPVVVAEGESPVPRDNADGDHDDGDDAERGLPGTLVPADVPGQPGPANGEHSEYSGKNP